MPPTPFANERKRYGSHSGPKAASQWAAADIWQKHLVVLKNRSCAVLGDNTLHCCGEHSRPDV